MKIWHKDLIKLLPDKMLIQQWNDCCLLVMEMKAREILSFSVRRVNNFNKSHFYLYCIMLWKEISDREIGNWLCSREIYEFVSDEERQISSRIEKDGDLFLGWHDTRYLVQNYYELQEMFDCGLITNMRWEAIYNFVNDKVEENERWKGTIRI